MDRQGRVLVLRKAIASIFLEVGRAAIDVCQVRLAKSRLFDADDGIYGNFLEMLLAHPDILERLIHLPTFSNRVETV